MHPIDHLLWEEWELGEALHTFAQRTGVTPALGGQHSATGTHNALFSFVLKATDFAEVGRRAKGIGLALSKIYTVSRTTPEGRLLTWQTVGIEGHGFGHYVPYPSTTRIFWGFHKFIAPYRSTYTYLKPSNRISAQRYRHSRDPSYSIVLGARNKNFTSRGIVKIYTYYAVK